MPRLPKGIAQKKGRPGYYARSQRSGKDRWTKLSNDLAEAKRKFKRMRAEPDEDTITIKKAARLWLAGEVRTRRSEKFRATTAQRVDDYLEPLLGPRRLASLTAEHCRKYRLELEQHVTAKGAPLSKQTVAHILADLRCFLRWAVDEGLVRRSPFPFKLLPKIQERAPDRLSDEEAAKLSGLPGADGFEFRLLLGAGMRWSEARRSQAHHLDDGALVIAHTKSGKVRRVPLSPALAGEIRGRVGRLFRFANAQTLAKRAKGIVVRLNLHRCRHTFAMQYLERGGSPHALSALLGHGSLGVTERYIRGLPVLAEREAREVMGRA